MSFSLTISPSLLLLVLLLTLYPTSLSCSLSLLIQSVSQSVSIISSAYLPTYPSPVSFPSPLFIPCPYSILFHFPFFTVNQSVGHSEYSPVHLYISFSKSITFSSMHVSFSLHSFSHVLILFSFSSSYS